MTHREQNRPFDPPSPPNQDGAPGWRWRQDLTRDLRTFAAAVSSGIYGARIALRRRALFPPVLDPDGDGLIYVDETGTIYAQLGGEWLALASAGRPPVGYEHLTARASTAPVGPNITSGWTDISWINTVEITTPGVTLDAGTSKITLTRAGVYSVEVKALVVMTSASVERLTAFRLREVSLGTTSAETTVLISRTATRALLQASAVFTVTDAQAAAALPLTLQVGGTTAVAGVTWTSIRLGIRSIGPI
jgi:hypothetical protein